MTTNIMNTVKTLSLALCEGRHEIPEATDGSVFRKIADPTKVAYLEDAAYYHIWAICNRKGYTYTPSEYWDADDMVVTRIMPNVHINLYVTGLTVALVAVLNVCRKNGITVTLYHYDRVADSYYPQDVE